MTLRYFEDGPTFPDELLEQLVAGEVVFLCGAGVSLPQLPGFKELVEKTFDRLDLEMDAGHRIVEIGCVELLNTIPTGETFHVYIDPERDIPEEAFRVHGLSAGFLAGKPVFANIADDFLKFTSGAKLIAHNAEFDMRFLNAELALLDMEPIAGDRVIDTLVLARRKFPGSANSLDALCVRYGIDTSRRTKHGALLDAEILAEVYAELTGGRQARLVFGEGANSAGIGGTGLLAQRPRPLPPRLSTEDLSHHRVFVDTLGTTPLWNRYFSQDDPAKKVKQA